MAIKKFTTAAVAIYLQVSEAEIKAKTNDAKELLITEVLELKAGTKTKLKGYGQEVADLDKLMKQLEALVG